MAEEAKEIDKAWLDGLHVLDVSLLIGINQALAELEELGK